MRYWPFTYSLNGKFLRLAPSFGLPHYYSSYDYVQTPWGRVYARGLLEGIIISQLNLTSWSRAGRPIFQPHSLDGEFDFSAPFVVIYLKCFSDLNEKFCSVFAAGMAISMF